MNQLGSWEVFYLPLQEASKDGFGSVGFLEVQAGVGSFLGMLRPQG